MTEAEWNASTDPVRTLDFLRRGDWRGCTDIKRMLQVIDGKATERKVRLFACACCRRISPLSTNQRSSHAIEVLEHVAEGLLPDLERIKILRMLTRFMNVQWGSILPESPKSLPDIAVNFAARRYSLSYFGAATYGARAVSYFWGKNRGCRSHPGPGLFRAESAAQAEIVRCIFGNPFQATPAINSAWFTSTVTEFAHSIYQDRAFDRLPILADALEDAGCGNGDILNHCRQPGEHARGCWVVDLLLGKS